MYYVCNQVNFRKPFSRISCSFGLEILLLCTLTIGLSVSNTIKAQSVSELDFLDANLSQISFEAKVAFDKKEYKEAARKYVEVLHHKSNDIQTLYNLAGCYSQLKKADLAVKALHHALDAGLSNLSLITSDSIWIPIQSNESYKKLVEYVKVLQKERGESFYAESKIIVKGHLRRPDNFDSTKAYPLIIILHGYGANPESYMVSRDQMQATNFFVAAPQGPYSVNFFDVENPSYSWFYNTKNQELWKLIDPFAESYVLAVIQEIKAHYKISNVYLLGHSQGGALAYMTGIGNPDVIRGVICFGAQNPEDFLNTDKLLNASSKLPIFISHGWADPKVKFDEAQKAKQLFLKYKFNVTLNPYKGGHGLDANALLEAKKWLDEIEGNNAVPVLNNK